MNNIPRLYWLDSLRGALVLGMIAYHAVWLFDLFYGSTLTSESPFWSVLGWGVRLGFLTVVGFSLFVSYINRTSFFHFLLKQGVRALIIFGCALLVTLVTWLFIPDAYVRFGILHLIAFGVLFGSLILPSKIGTVVVLVFSVFLGSWLPSFSLKHEFLIPFGLLPSGFYSVDYFPVFPWFSVILFGTLVCRLFAKLDWLKNPLYLFRLAWLEFIGKKALIIYLIHLPVLIFIFWLFG